MAYHVVPVQTRGLISELVSLWVTKRDYVHQETRIEGSVLTTSGAI